mgnify:CR=1 FL=1|jgi:hypothetical protein|tara:strand:- start:133 stop:402 length:270 start_codon:yes stop_codon:yes gene_type:complete
MANANNDEKIFAEGFSFKKQENAPDFVVGRVSVKCDEAVSFMKEHQSNGWINLNIKYAKSGKPYMELDTWKPTEKKEAVSAQEDENLPF